MPKSKPPGGAGKKPSKSKVKVAAQAVHPQNVATRVKQVLAGMTNVTVTNQRTMHALGLHPVQVQLAMNTEFFAGTNVRLSEAECAPDVTVEELIITISEK